MYSAYLADFNLSDGGFDTYIIELFHEMVSDRSSRAEAWTDRRNISRHLVVGSEKHEHIKTIKKKNANIYIYIYIYIYI